MRRVVVVGQSSFDIIHVDRKPAASFTGGRLANMAVSLARAGVPVEFASECAADSVGDIIVDHLRENGVGVGSVDRFTDGQTEVSLIFRDTASGTESYASYVDYPKSRFDILWPKIDNDDILVFGSYFSIVDDVRQPLQELLAYAIERKAIIIYLPGFQPGLCSRITRVMPAIFENLEAADMVVAREADMAKIFEKTDPEKCFNDHIRFYSSHFLFTDAALNATLYAGGERLSLPYAGARPASKLGWDASLCAGFVSGLIAEDITRDTLETAGRQAWENVLATARRFADSGGAAADNAIDRAAAEKISKKQQ